MKPPRFLLVLRMVLGLIFIAASVTKLSEQSQFVNEVVAYGLLPHNLALLYGVALPWVELFTGIALVLGIFTIPALVLCILMAFGFAIGNTYALAWGIADSCGSCFGQLIPLKLNVALWIDVLIIITAAVMLSYRRKADSINLNSFFLASINLNIPRMSQQSALRIVEAILLIVIVLAVGLPLSLSKATSAVYSEMDTILEQGKPVLLMFVLEGCGECEEQKPIIEELENLYRDSISFITADYHSDFVVAQDFEVTHVPTILLIVSKEPDGYIVLQRFTGLTSKEKIQRSFYDKLDEDIICRKYGPIAKFAASPTSGRVPLNVEFTDLSLGKVEGWSWDFDNDGITDSTLQNPSHIYEEAGIYAVTLTVHGPCGSSTSTLQGYLRLDPKSCIADFDADSKSVVGRVAIQFNDRSESEGNIAAWEWDFNADGTVDSTEPNPVYTYTSNGVYSVILTIRTADCEDTITKRDYISVTGCSG